MKKKIILPQVCFISRILFWPFNDAGRRKLIYFFSNFNLPTYLNHICWPK